MGNENSTRWKGKAVKNVVERQARLNVLDLYRRGLLKTGATGALDLDGLSTFYGRDTLFLWRDDFIQTTPVSWVRCGPTHDDTKWRGGPGTRPFLVCDCGRKVRYFYRSGGAWVCRRCAGLNYRIQRIRTPERRGWTPLKKIFFRFHKSPWFAILGPDEPLPPDLPKPPRMWRKKFAALIAEHAKLMRKFKG